MEILIVGSCGLIGSEAVEYFARLGHSVHGIDNNMRADFFGPQGDTNWRLKQLIDGVSGYTHHSLDIRDRVAIMDLFEDQKPGAIIHCAAQPSHGSGQGSTVR